MKRKIRNCNIACKVSGIAIMILFVIAVSADRYNVMSAFMLLPFAVVYAYCDTQRNKARRMLFEKKFGKNTYRMMEAMEEYLESERR